MRTLKNTSQRKAIISFLQGNKDHPTADEIYNALKKQNCSLSLATVYNTLNTLKGQGLLRELAISSKRRRYDPNTTEHHHFICNSCGKVYDIEDQIIVKLPDSLARQFDVVSHQVEFYGYCNICKSETLIK